MKHACVIVDTRPIRKDILLNHRLEGFEMIVYSKAVNRLLCDELDIEFRECPDIKTFNDYNRYFTSFNFWIGLVKYDRVLIFQQDSRLLHKDVNKFLKYDYIGAPIKNFKFPAMNGGLSLRNPSEMIRAIKHGLFHSEHNEDIRFSYTLQKLNSVLPDENTAKSFSVETLFHDCPFGVHACNKYLTPEKLRLIKGYDKLPI